jgi:hypothetical protein
MCVCCIGHTHICAYFLDLHTHVCMHAQEHTHTRPLRPFFMLIEPGHVRGKGGVDFIVVQQKNVQESRMMSGVR